MNLWMQPEKMPAGSALITFRNVFTVEKDAKLSLCWSADEEAQLFLDGDFVTTGPEKSAPEYWYCNALTLPVSAGTHTLSARVNTFAGMLNYTKMSCRPGFYCRENSQLLGAWECRVESGISFEAPFPDWGSVPRVHVDPEYDQGEWHPVTMFEDARELHLSAMPPMRNERVEPQEIRSGFFYFRRYVCCRTVWHFKGHGSVKIRWSETPYLTTEFHPLYLKGEKGNRDGKFFVGNFDVFRVDGELVWHDLQRRAGHYVEVFTDGNLSFDAEFYDTGYPLPEYSGVSELGRMAVETLRACSYDTFMDCPFYERLLYSGDSRLEALALYSLTDDHKLAAKTLRMLLLSQKPDGSIRSQYPSRVEQVIPSFMPIFVLTFHDYWLRHPQDSIVTELLPKLHRLVGYLCSCVTDHGVEIPGWQFIDWTQNWNNGVPKGICAVSQMTLLAFDAAKEIFPDDNTLETLRDKLAKTIEKCYYCPELQLFADDLEHTAFSEHAQALAVLNGFPNVRLDAPDLTPCSIYFSYYYLCACRKLHRADLLTARMARFKALAAEGLTTLPEEFDNPRSDCHAWGAYVLLFPEAL